MSEPYNPLDKINLARSIEGELLVRPAAPLAEIGQLLGAGVYVIYYRGDFTAYDPISAANETEFVKPIYVGKAIPKGGRKGGLAKPKAGSHELADRLRQHAASIAEATNLNLADFWVRSLVVEDIWIPLGENMLIESFKPLWNRAVDGFGNKDPGKRRATQFKSPWDVVHPGRLFAEKLADSTLTAGLVLKRVADYFSDRPLTKLPKAVAEQQALEDVLQDEDLDEQES